MSARSECRATEAATILLVDDFRGIRSRLASDLERAPRVEL